MISLQLLVGGSEQSAANREMSKVGSTLQSMGEKI